MYYEEDFEYSEYDDTDPDVIDAVPGSAWWADEDGLEDDECPDWG